MTTPYNMFPNAYGSQAYTQPAVPSVGTAMLALKVT